MVMMEIQNVRCEISHLLNEKPIDTEILINFKYRIKKYLHNLYSFVVCRSSLYQMSNMMAGRSGSIYRITQILISQLHVTTAYPRSIFE